MNLESEILKEHSKQQAVRIARWIGNDKRRFRQLMQLFLRGEYRVTQRASWIVNICADNNPSLIQPYLKKMISRMQEPGTHDAVRRNVIRILQFIDIPQDLLGSVATVCFEYLYSQKTPVAIKAFSMTVLANIAKKEPDLKREIRLAIEYQLPHSSAGTCARARHVLKSLDEPS